MARLDYEPFKYDFDGGHKLTRLEKRKTINYNFDWRSMRLYTIICELIYMHIKAPKKKKITAQTF